MTISLPIQIKMQTWRRKKQNLLFHKKCGESHTEKTAPSTNEQLKSIEEHKEPSVWEELKEGCKESCREFILFQLCTTEGVALLCVIAFILLWIFAGFGWAVAVVILGLVIGAAIWVVRKMMG